MKKLTCDKYLDQPRCFLGSLFLFSIILLCTDLTFANDNFSKVFPHGEGSDVVTRNCTGCHSSETVLQNSMTRERWDGTITIMQEKHGLWDLDPETRNQILNYLSTVRGISEKNQRKRHSSHTVMNINRIHFNSGHIFYLRARNY